MQNKKLEKLLAKSEELNKKIKQDSERKARFDKEIEQIQAREIMKFLSDREIEFGDTLFQIIELAKKAIEKGFTVSDIEKMLELKSKSDTDKMEVRNEKKID